MQIKWKRRLCLHLQFSTCTQSNVTCASCALWPNWQSLLHWIKLKLICWMWQYQSTLPRSTVGQAESTGHSNTYGGVCTLQGCGRPLWWMGKHSAKCTKQFNNSCGRLLWTMHSITEYHVHVSHGIQVFTVGRTVSETSSVQRSASIHLPIKRKLFSVKAHIICSREQKTFANTHSL